MMTSLARALLLGLLPGKVFGEYIAGVANHDVFFGSGSDDSSYLIDMNLQLYENLTLTASTQGAQVLVFPEFGLEAVPMAERADLYPYAEYIPEVIESVVTPCDHADEYADRPILYRLSCAAKKNSLLLLANMIDFQPCDSATDEHCPSDGHYQYNTDVLFDEMGALVAKYHKTHVWLSNLGKYDQPYETEYVTYNSPTLGVEFGLFICFDIMFPDPPKVLVQRGVKHFLYAVQQGYLGDVTLMPHWSRENNAALLASNLIMGGDDKTKESVSRVFVKGETVRGKKYSLDNEKFSYENVLIVTVPTDF